MIAPVDREFRPLQLYHLPGDGVRCETLRPDDGLSDWVYYYWLMRIDADQLTLDVIPDNALDLVVSPAVANFAALYFPVDQPFSIALDGPATYAGVSLRADCAAGVFGRELAALKAIPQGAETVSALSLEPLTAGIQGVGSMDGIARVLGSFVSDRVSRNAVPGSGVIRHLLTHLEPGGIETVANTLGISERQMRRLSTGTLGLSPKKVQRVLRLQRVLSELLRGQGAELREGYYDDSHLIRELKRLTGLTPGQLRRMAENYNPGSR